MVHHLAMQISLKIHPQLNRSGWGDGWGEGDSNGDKPKAYLFRIDIPTEKHAAQSSALCIERKICRPNLSSGDNTRPCALSSRKAANVMQKSTADKGRPRTTRSRQRFGSVISS